MVRKYWWLCIFCLSDLKWFLIKPSDYNKSKLEWNAMTSGGLIGSLCGYHKGIVGSAYKGAHIRTQGSL